MLPEIKQIIALETPAPVYGSYGAVVRGELIALLRGYEASLDFKREREFRAWGAGYNRGLDVYEHGLRILLEHYNTVLS